MPPLVSVVVPTYGEADHIQDLLREVGGACHALDHEIIVVDDNSPDGTHAKVVEWSRTHPQVVPVLRVHEKGLATAVIEGMRRAQGTFIVVMDSDFQHPPRTVPQLVAAAQTADADLVVASRYVPGGSVTGFPLQRRVISWGAKMLAVVALPRVREFQITDPMSGFFLVRRDAIDPDTLHPIGYKILVEVIARTRIRRAAEVGFAFDVRRGGESKLRLSTQWDYFRHVLQLAWRDRENLRMALFSVVGLTGIVVNVALYALLKEPLDARASTTLLLVPAAIAREASILWNFTWNDTITFHDLRRHAHASFLHRLLRFNAVSLISAAAYLVVFWILFDLLHVPDIPALLIAILLTFIINYGGNRRWTYAARRETAHG